MNALPVEPSCSFGRPATLTYIPSDAVPAPSTSAEIGVKPSGAMIVTLVARTDRRSLISLPPFSQIRPPRKTASAPDCLILFASDSYDEAFGSHAVKPADERP